MSKIIASLVVVIIVFSSASLCADEVNPNCFGTTSQQMMDCLGLREIKDVPKYRAEMEARRVMTHFSFAPDTKQYLRDFNSGAHTNDVGSDDNVGRDIIFQDDGKMIVVGRASNGSYNDYLIERRWPDGSLDTTFDGDGRVVTTFGAGEAMIHSITSDSSGRLVVAGRHWGNVDHDFQVSRYFTDGSVDTSFGFEGHSRINFAGDDFARGVDIDSQGRIVISGHSGFNTGTPPIDFNYVTARLTSDGNLDTSFSTDGIVILASAQPDFTSSQLVLSDDSIMTAGTLVNGGDRDWVILDIGTGGTFDSFGFVDPSIGNPDFIWGMTTDSTERIIVVGNSHNGANNDFAIARFPRTLGFGLQEFLTITTIGANSDVARDVIVDGSGEYVVMGHRWNGADWDLASARYLTDGTLDATYGTAGLTTAAVGGDDDRVFRIAYLNGMIVGSGASMATDEDLLIARYNSDGLLAASGDLDENFDTDGFVSDTLAGAGNEQGFMLRFNTAGRIMVVGQSNNGVGFARYHTTGALDTSFSTDGLESQILSASTGDLSYGFEIQTDGKIVAVSYDNGNVAALRVNQNGGLDATFGTAGVFSQNIGGGVISYAFGLALDSQERIILSGSTTNVLEDFMVVRLTTGGALDPSFGGGGGFTVTDMGGTFELPIGALVESGTDKPIIGGYVLNTDWEVGIARYNTDGTPDTTFNGTGRTMFDVGANTNDLVWRLAGTTDGKIYAMGASNNDMLVMRFNSNGTLDNTFSGDGIVTQNIFGGDFAYDMKVQGNGKIVISGASGGELSLMRLMTDGSFDTNFDDDGRIRIDVGTGTSFGYGVLLASDGRIITGGAINNGTLGFGLAQVWP